MAGNENNDNNESGSNKTPGKDPQEPKNSSDSEYYINKHGKKVKRRKKRTAEQNKRHRESEKENYKKKAEAEGREITQRESLVGLTDQQKKDRTYKLRRDNIKKKQDQDFKDFPFLKEITPRRKNKGMSQEEIKEFDKTTVELRKKSSAAYWDANKHREELKRPGRSTIKYRDEHNLWENKDYFKPLKNRKNAKFVEPNLKGKEIAKEVLSEELLDKGKGKAKEVLSEELLDKGKGKAKVIEEMDSLSDSEYSPESSEDSTFQDDLYKAIEQSKEQDGQNKKGESSKRSK